MVIKRSLALIGILGWLASCTEEVDLDLPEADDEIVVEGFINDEFPLKNYVFLTRVQSYNQKEDREVFVRDAEVFVTPGDRINGEIKWAEEEQVEFEPVDNDTLGLGYYQNDLSNPLQGEEGRYYKLEAYTQEDTITGHTFIPHTIEKEMKVNYNEENENAVVSLTFQDPPNERNYYRQQYEVSAQRSPLWGQMSGTDVFSDEDFQGQEFEINYEDFFEEEDTLQNYLMHIDEGCFKYLNSKFEAEAQGGPFASPVEILSNVDGALGGFCGMAVSHEEVRIADFN